MDVVRGMNVYRLVRAQLVRLGLTQGQRVCPRPLPPLLRLLGLLRLLLVRVRRLVLPLVLLLVHLLVAA